MDQRTFSIRRADHVGFAVSSLDAALDFWVGVLGARLVRTSEMGGHFLEQVTGARGADVKAAIVDLAGQTIELLEYTGVASGAARAPQPFHPGIAHLALIVTDLDAVLTRVAGYGWKPQGTPQSIVGGPRAGTKVMYVTGPDGATIEFMQPPD